MRYFICYFALIFIVGCNTDKGRDSNKFADRERLESFIGQRVGDFLSEKDNLHYLSLSIVDEPPGKAYCLSVYYKDNFRIKLIPYKFKFMKSYDENRQWDIEKFKLETVDEIGVYRNDSLILKVR